MTVRRNPGRNGRARRDSEDDTGKAVISCPFERAILSRKCSCRLAERTSLEMRLKIVCGSASDHRDCAEILNHMRKNLIFSLGLKHAPNALPADQAVKLQCGALIGLQNALDLVVENERVNNIHDTVQRAKKRYGPVESFPEQEIIRSIATFGK